MSRKRKSLNQMLAPRLNRRASRRCRFELLEPRLPLSANASPFAPVSFSTQANGLPILTSFPTAPAMIYLDYDGEGTTSELDLDSPRTPGVFSAFEQQRIVEHWRGLSAIFSPFNVGVTTVKPDTDSVPTEWISITNDMLGKGGVNGVGSFPDDAPSGVSGADWWAEGYSHEISHGFGNWHQSSYDLLGNKTDEYAPFPMDDPLRGNIMGNGSGTVIKWQNGHSSLDGKTIQLDADTIAASIAAEVGGDGYRPDDQTSTSKTGSTALTVFDSTTQAIIGIIEKNTDQDWYTFASVGGAYNIMVGRDNPSPVDIKLSIYGSDGTTLLAFDDGDPLSSATPGSYNYRTNVNDSHVTMTLPAGTYYLKVEGHGNYADQGQYIARVDRMQDGWQSKDIGLVESPGFTDFDPATNTFTMGGSGRGMGGTLASGGDGAQFAYTKLVGDGEIIAQVASIESVTSVIRAGITMRESLATGSTFFSAYATPSSHVSQQRRSSTDGNSSTQTASAAPSGPVWLRIKRAGDTFTAYYSTDGTSWTTVSSSVTIVMGSEVYVGLLSTSANDLDRLTSNFLSTATFTNVSVKVSKEADIGAVGVAGSMTYNASTGVYTLKGNGRGWGNIASQQDASFVSYHNLVGDGSITARLASISSVSATSGVMIRESLNTNSKYFATWIKPNQGVVRSFRDTTGGISNESVAGLGPYWMRIERSGNVFRSYTSTDGVQWTQIGGDQTIDMNASVLIGMMVATGNTITINTSTFGNLTLTGGIDGAQSLNDMPAPTNVQLSGVASTSATVSWTNPYPPLPGDYTQDNTINAADFVSFRKSDASATGYNNWRRNFGVTQPTVTGFTVERSIDNVNFQSVGDTAANVLTFTDTTLTGTQKYYYRVRTNDAVGVSTPSTVVSATARAPAVTGLKVYSYSTSELVIEWLDVNGETDYTLQRSSNGTSGWTNVGTSTITKNTVIYVNTGRTAGTQYFYRVTTVDASGNSDTSAVVSAYTRLSSKPANFTFSSPNSTSISFSWDALSGITRYAVYRGRSNSIGEWDLLNSNVTTTSFTDSGLSSSSKHYYRVIGYDANGAATQTAEIFGWGGLTTPAVPSPWVSTDIGTVGVSGAAGFSNGTFTLIGGGADIYGNSDEFRYVYTQMTGNGFIEVRVASMNDPAANYWSRAGIQIRESTATGSRQASLMLHTTDGGVRMQYRTSTNGGTGETPPAALVSARAPYWFRLERTGDIIVGKASVDHVNWTTVDTIDMAPNVGQVALSNTVFIGMALTPRDDNYAHWATFDNVSSTPTGAVGSPAPEGAATGPLTTSPQVSLPALPESVFASGAVGAFGASSSLQAIASYLCQCCLYDCGGTPGPTAAPADHVAAILPDAHLSAGLSSSPATSVSTLDSAMARSFASPAAFQSLTSTFRHEHHGALDYAFEHLDSHPSMSQLDGISLDSIASAAPQQAHEGDHGFSDDRTDDSNTNDQSRSDTQSLLTDADVGGELDNSLSVFANKAKRS